MILIVVFYSNIVRAVVAHEAALRAQAKKMNVDSLRSGAQSEESAEIKIAKVDTISRYLDNNVQKMVMVIITDKLFTRWPSRTCCSGSPSGRRTPA